MRGQIELHHIVDVVPLAASTVTPIRYDEVSCGIAPKQYGAERL